MKKIQSETTQQKLWKILIPSPCLLKMVLTSPFLHLFCFVGKLAMKFIQDNSINYWPTPAGSLDMNPIENHWHKLKYRYFLRTVVKAFNKEQLVAGIQGFWDTMTPEKCRHYIGYLKKVFPAVVEREGRASGY